jgi:phospho-N-acetylmuramoyl-pentapeptide-transferase
MLYYLLYQVLQRYFSPFNVFRYITVRTVYASLTAMFLAFVFGPWLIRKLRELQIGQFIREEGPQAHQKKAGTPTMGGVLIVLSTLVPTLLWADLTNGFVLLAIFSLLSFATIGFIDDYAKVSKQRNLGLTSKKKFLLQILVSFIIGTGLLALATRSAYSAELVVPFLKKVHPDLVVHSLLTSPLWPLAFIPFLIFVSIVIAGASNAVNLTDGLDGLAIGCTVIAAGADGAYLRLAAITAGRPIWTLDISSRGGAHRILARWSAHPLVFSGTTRIPRKCSWAMLAPCRWVERWESSRW